MSYHKYKVCLEQYLKCATLCHHNVYTCLLEEDVAKYKTCIQLCSECAVMCLAATQMVSLGSHVSREVAGLCAQVCNACAVECEKHPESLHCRECAEACRICIECMSY